MRVKDHSSFFNQSSTEDENTYLFTESLKGKQREENEFKKRDQGYWV